MIQNSFRRVCEPLSEPYHYTECGLDDVYLLNGYDVVETPYGSGMTILDEDALLHVIALSLVQRRALLAGREVRFLRRRLDMTQAELAKLLRVDAQTLARWEKGETKLHGAADGLIRVIYMIGFDQDVSKEFLDYVTSLDIGTEEQMKFRETEDGWTEAA